MCDQDIHITDGCRFSFTLAPDKFWLNGRNDILYPEDLLMQDDQTEIHEEIKSYMSSPIFRNYVEYKINTTGRDAYSSFNYWYEIQITTSRGIDYVDGTGIKRPAVEFDCVVCSRDDVAIPEKVRSVVTRVIDDTKLALGIETRARQAAIRRRKTLRIKRALCSWAELRGHVQQVMYCGITGNIDCPVVDEYPLVSQMHFYQRSVVCFRTYPDIPDIPDRLLKRAARSWIRILSNPYDPRGRRFQLRMFDELLALDRTTM